MKKITLYLFLAILSSGIYSSCQSTQEETSTEEVVTEDEPMEENEEMALNENAVPNEAGGYGSIIDTEGAISAEEMASRVAESGSVDCKVSGKITDVCQNKGCWMKMSLADGEEVMVQFRDYGFFVPFDIPGSEVVIQGTASIDTMSVDDLRHYASDEGKSEEEIEAITEPELQLVFVADGVMMK